MKFNHRLASLSLFATLAAGMANTALAHATLTDATPAKDAEVTAAPKEVVLHFNEKLEPAFSNVKLIDGKGKAIKTAKATPDSADPSIMKLALPALGPGKYTVQYTVVGHDGHRRKGDYSFTVK